MPPDLRSEGSDSVQEGGAVAGGATFCRPGVSIQWDGDWMLTWEQGGPQQ